MNEREPELSEVFMETHHLFHRYHMIWHSKNLGDFDPRRGQGRILTALKKMSGVNQRELAFILDIRPQSLGELLQKLEQNGYITRRIDENDKRSLIVELTEKGRNLKFQRPNYENIFNCLNEAEQNNMKHYLQLISSRLEELIDNEDNNND